MSTTINIKEMHISFIWAETIVDALKLNVPDTMRFKFLGRSSSFGPLFEKAREHPVVIEPADGLLLRMPWPHLGGQRFWRSYLNQQPLEQVDGKTAWKSLLPLRAIVPYPIQAPQLGSGLQLGSALSFHAFLYPHGLALVVTAHLCGEIALTIAVDAAFRLRRNGKFIVGWQPGQSEKASLDSVIDQILTRMRRYGWGEAAPSRRVALDPFTIVTVVRASGVDPTASISPGSEVHRTLEAITNWHINWQNAVLPEIEKVRISSHTAPIPGTTDLLYSAKRGRAVWFPGLFTGAPNNSTLACYHQNLTFASLQVESLSGLTRETAIGLEENGDVPFYHKECARNASGILGRIYGGNSSIYRTWSARAQIEQNEFMKDINTARLFFGMSPLA